MERSPPWFDDRTDLVADRSVLPAEADVVILGGGLAGLAVAAFLASASTRVVVLEERSHLADGVAGRGPGLVLRGLAEAPHQLFHSLGEDMARQVYRFTDENASIVDELGALHEGAVSFTTNEREASTLEQDLDVLRRLGFPALPADAKEIQASAGIATAGPGRRLDRDGWTEPVGLVRKLLARARAQKAVVRTSARVDRIVVSGPRLSIVTGEQEIATEAVVLAGGAWLPEVEPALQDKLYPVRMQLLATEPCGAAGAAFTAQNGHLYGRPTEDGRWILGGARWATPHLEEGEGDDNITSDIVHAKLVGFHGRWFPGTTISHAWSTIAAHTCDGLPLVGPLPGRGRFVVCAGWCGRPHSLALRAARGIADGLLTGKAPGVPRLFEPSRFV